MGGRAILLVNAACLGAFSSRNASGTAEDLKAGDVRHLRRINFFGTIFMRLLFSFRCRLLAR
jgi:hypothetical protein